MQRRQFIAASLSASASALTAGSASHSPMTAAIPANPAREFYLLRRFGLRMGPQTALLEQYFAEALLPALTRLGFTPVGAFKLDIGPETPTYYLLIPSASPATLATLDDQLAKDEVFLKAAQPLWAAPASSPSFDRVESTLLLAFEGWPKLTSPAAGTKARRIFQLRTYESPSEAAHIRKLEMFNHGEFEIFQRNGLHPVFFGQTLVGSRMPSLTYMLSFADSRELEANWAAFGADPAWKQLSTSPRYAYESIVSNISNLILSPLSTSQI